MRTFIVEYEYNGKNDNYPGDILHPYIAGVFPDLVDDLHKFLAKACSDRVDTSISLLD